jgi:hypothetical protein
MRTLSSEVKKDIQRQSIEDIYLTLIELSYTVDEVEETFYIVNNHQAIVSNNKTYLPLAFSFTIPQDSETVQNAKITIDNVDRRIAAFALSAPPNTKIYVEEHLLAVDLVDPTSNAGIEMSRSYLLKNVQVTRAAVVGDLSYLEYLQYRYPYLTKTPSKFPGVF